MPATECDCCVERMKEYLESLEGATNISIATTIQSAQGGFTNATINRVVGDYVIINNGDAAIPICKIVGLGGSATSALLTTPLPSSEDEEGGFCECCEQATREILQLIKDRPATADFLTEGSGDFGNLQNFTILEIQEGLVKIRSGNDVRVLSTCHIAALSDINPNLIVP